MRLKSFPFRLVILLLAGCVIVPHAGSAQSAPSGDAASLLAKHKAFVGWQLGDGSFRRLSIAGSVESPGKPGSARSFTELREGLLSYRSERTLDTGFEWDSGFTGSVFWYSDENGFTVPRVGDERQVALAENALFDEGTTTLPATFQRFDDLDGHRVAVVRESIPNGIALDLWEDVSSGAYLRADIDPAGMTRTILIDRYATIVPGKRMLVDWREGPGLDRYSTTVTANPTFDKDALHPPRSVARWTFAASPIPIPIKVADDGFRIDARVGGVRGHFLLDTTSRTIQVSPDFAERAHLSALQARSHLAKADIAFDDGSALSGVVVAMSYEPALGNEDIDGVLGFDFLAGAIVDVDVDGAQLTLYDPSRFGANPQNTVLALDLAGGQPSIGATLDKSTPTTALLSSAGPEAIALSSAYDGPLHLKEVEEIRAPGGTTPCGTLESLRIGAVNYDAQPACFSTAVPARQTSLGFEFLKYLNLTFDYPDARLVIVPRKR